MFSGGQSKGYLHNQGDFVLFLINEVCFTALFEAVITSVSKVKRDCRKHVKKVHGWYVYFDSKPNISTTDTAPSLEITFMLLIL